MKSEAQDMQDLVLDIERYRTSIRAGRYDAAQALFYEQLAYPLKYRVGAYRTAIAMLRDLFLDGEDRLPALKNEGHQVWTLNELATCYGLSGQTRRAVPLLELANEIDERRGNKAGLAIGLGNLADQCIELGELKAADAHLRQRIAICRETGDEFREAVGHQELGRLLAYEGVFHESARELGVALAAFCWQEEIQSEGIVWSHRALRATLMEDPGVAVEAARRALELAGKEDFIRDVIKAEWLLGNALVALACEAHEGRDEILAEAETHLTHAYANCRRIHLMELVPLILLAWAHWESAQRHADKALPYAEEALAIAERCAYRLKQAEVLNFLAALALERDDTATAARHAQAAYERAWCDGPPHWHKAVIDDAGRIMAQLGVPLPRPE